MAWDGKYWGKKGSVAIAEQQFELSQKKPIDYANYALVCYLSADRVCADLMHLRWSGVKRIGACIKLSKQSLYLSSHINLDTLRNESKNLNEYARILKIICLSYSRFGRQGGKQIAQFNKVVSEVKLLLLECSSDDGDESYVLPCTQAILELLVVNTHINVNDHRFERINDLLKTVVADGYLSQASTIAYKMSEKIDEYKLRMELRSLAKKLALSECATDQLAKM